MTIDLHLIPYKRISHSKLGMGILSGVLNDSPIYTIDISETWLEVQINLGIP